MKSWTADRSETKKSGISTNDLFALAIYGLTNALFVYKYSSRIISHSGALSVLYLVMLSMVILLLYRRVEFRFSLKVQNMIYLSLVACLAVSLTVLMFHFDPEKIRVGRYPAIYDWISRLLNSEFPYASGARPSGFPFLFVMAMPFYFVGDLGFFQIFGFLVFAFLVHLRYGGESMNKYRCLFLLITSPMFLYEIVVRSDLFSNMVLVMLYLAIFEIVSTRPMSHVGLSLLGLAGGLLLSTRGVVLLIYVAFFGYFFGKRAFNQALFFGSMLVGFLLPLVPFAIWNWNRLTSFGPFSIQLSLIPNWLLIVSIISTLCCALTIRSLARIYSSVAFLLFGVTCAAFILSVLGQGWYQAILGDRFDISYFCFALPFLLISLDFDGKRTARRQVMFAFRPADHNTCSQAISRQCSGGLLKTDGTSPASRESGTGLVQSPLFWRSAAEYAPCG